MLDNLRELNGWSKRWGPLIALASAIVALLSLLLVLPVGPNTNTTAAPPSPSRQASPAPKAAETNPQISPSRPEDIWAIALQSAYEHRRDLNLIGLQIECRHLLEDGTFNARTQDQRNQIRSACLSPILEHSQIKHYDQYISGAEDRLLESAKDLIGRFHANPAMGSDFTAICGQGNEEDFRGLIHISWISVALKAYLIANSYGLGKRTTEAIERGASPQEALPPLPLSDGLSTVSYLSKSYRILTTYQIDQVLHRYSDDDLIGWAEKLSTLLPEPVRKRLRRTVEMHLEEYRSNIKPKSGTIIRAYKDAMLSGELVTLNSGRMIANFPNDTLFSSCPKEHLARFWMRRILNGTDARVEDLGNQFLRRN